MSERGTAVTPRSMVDVQGRPHVRGLPLDKVGVHLDTFVDSTGRVSDLEPLSV